MKQKLLITAVGFALAGGMSMANADVQLYGNTNVSIDSIDVDGGSDDINMNSNTASLGIKGSESLSDGLDVLFKYEFSTDISESPNGLTGRDQYLGLKGGFGRVLFGTASTAYKSPGSKIDPWYRTSIQSRSIGLQSNLHSGKGEEGAGRGRNIIRYDTPKMGGFGVTATYQLDNTEGDGEDDDPFSIGLTYGGGGAYVFASYIDTQRSGDNSAFQVGGKYSISGFTIRGIYEADQGLITDRRSTGSSQDDGADIWSAGVDYKIANNLISFDYGQTSDSDGRDGVNNTGDDILEADIWRLGAQHMFSKRTKAYLGYANVDVDKGGETEILTLGMRHKF
jgi:predicted porin